MHLLVWCPGPSPPPLVLAGAVCRDPTHRRSCEPAWRPWNGGGGRSTDIRRVNTTSHLGVAFYACRCLRLEEGEAFVYRHSSVSFQCLKQYVELLIKEGLETAISCPDAACPKQGQLQDSEARAGATGFGGCAAGRRACRGVAGPVPADLRDVPALGLSYSSFVFLSP